MRQQVTPRNRMDWPTRGQVSRHRVDGDDYLGPGADKHDHATGSQATPRELCQGSCGSGSHAVDDSAQQETAKRIARGRAEVLEGSGRDGARVPTHSHRQARIGPEDLQPTGRESLQNASVAALSMQHRTRDVAWLR